MPDGAACSRAGVGLSARARAGRDIFLLTIRVEAATAQKQEGHPLASSSSFAER